jgi:hypothetical protein
LVYRFDEKLDFEHIGLRLFSLRQHQLFHLGIQTLTRESNFSTSSGLAM